MIGVIADDLTGAAEIGAIGLRHGLRAIILVGGKPDADADLVCIDTDSRSCPANEAAKRTASAARTLRRAGAKWIYKKIDSVLRGNVTAELHAVMKELKLERALVAPANPTHGRTIRDGSYFIRKKPLDQTEFANDPEHPRTSARVLECILPIKKCPIQVCTLKDPLPDSGIVIAEAATTNDLKAWAGRINPRMLAAGAAEFFEALLQVSGYVGSRRKAVVPHDVPRELFVCGTASPSARQLTVAARRKKAPVFSLPRELAWGAELDSGAKEAIVRRIATAFKSHRRIVLNIGLPMARHPFAASELVPHLTAVAELALRQTIVGHVHAEGGATAAALVNRMRWRHFRVVRELAPGIATLAVEGDTSRLLTVKPGSYPWPSWVLNRSFSSTRM